MPAKWLSLTKICKKYGYSKEYFFATYSNVHIHMRKVGRGWQVEENSLIAYLDNTKPNPRPAPQPQPEPVPIPEPDPPPLPDIKPVPISKEELCILQNATTLSKPKDWLVLLLLLLLSAIVWIIAFCKGWLIWL